MLYGKHFRMVKISLLYLAVFQYVLHTTVVESSGNIACDGLITDLQANKKRQKLEFPGTQTMSNSRFKCVWRITALEVENNIEIVLDTVQLNSHINCTGSSLTVYDGLDSTDLVLIQECHNRSVSITRTSTIEYVYLEWRHPANVDTNSFSLWYRGKYKERKTFRFNKNTAAAVIAGIILGLVFFTAVTFVGICYCRNQRRIAMNSKYLSSTEVPYFREIDSVL